LIRHCVFLKFRSEIRLEERSEIYGAVASLKSRLAGIRDIEFGVNMSPEALDKGFDEGFIVTFENASARDDYLADAEHTKVGARIVAATQGGSDGVSVFDLDTTDLRANTI
jgi:hypothetical protein